MREAALAWELQNIKAGDDESWQREARDMVRRPGVGLGGDALDGELLSPTTDKKPALGGERVGEQNADYVPYQYESRMGRFAGV